MSPDFPVGDAAAQLALIEQRILPLDVVPEWGCDEVENAQFLREAMGITEFRDAAVLIGLVRREKGLTVLLTVRAEDLRSHAGQVSFPGGRVDEGDASVVHAALRELTEETGIEDMHVRPIGVLPPLATISGYQVVPVVAEIDSTHAITLNPTEVAEIFEAPLAWLLDSANLEYRDIGMGAMSRRVPQYLVDADHAPHLIWGATAMMLQSLRSLLETRT